jgi:hypothetical protein
MSTPENHQAPSGARRPPARGALSARGQRVLLLGTLGLLLAIGGTYAAFGDWSTGAGVLCGGGLVLGLMWFAGRRAARRGVEAATAERVFSGQGDERDNRVYLVTMAVVGLVGFVASALLPAASGLGLDADTALRVLPYLLIVTAVVSFVVVDRRT